VSVIIALFLIQNLPLTQFTI